MLSCALTRLTVIDANFLSFFFEAVNKGTEEDSENSKRVSPGRHKGGE